ncbi:multiple inositol polyphosphate phosphatase 1 [Spodoptera frugiperda]|uniref:Multiple inositol polyphosphate phosphatase 1 n=1 Tax=Spodoptera frugiperda TaxID=7108 RepID=A0A9R0D1J2_SPOFR|nr:multiple inositol polyphosphate phosphatase 1 [Spodoptera frugiperda]
MQVLLTVIVLALINYIDLVGSLKTSFIRQHLGSRTPYRFRANKNDSRIKYPGCKDTKIWMVIRHGTRLPSRKDLNAVSKLVDLKYEVLWQHEYGKGQLTNEQFNSLQDWRLNIDPDQDSYLTLEGQDEMILMAERMQKRFPNAIKQKYSNKTFLFRYTATQRAQQSARYFTNGLFEKKDAQDIIFAPATRVDPVLRFYKHCDRWLSQVKKNPDTYNETRLFGHSRLMNDTLESVSKRLGLSRVLRLETVELMYKFCGYETSWDKHHISPWCYAFDEDSMQVFEYYHDLKTYWLDGYGHELTYRQACMSIKNMFEFFDKRDGYQSIFMFSHSGTILKILTHLKLYQPSSPLRGDAIVKDRPWKLSEIDCFAANLAFVLFKCKDGDHVLTLHQEKIIKLPMCKHELCPLKHLREYFHDSIFKCDYTDMCSLQPNSTNNKED